MKKTTRALLACPAILLAIFFSASSSQGAAKRPNIIIMMADDMGFSDIGCYGGEIRTPTLDWLAHPGLRVPHFYNNAVCVATRPSLLPDSVRGEVRGLSTSL